MAKTDGVPLFVEELTKMVLESGLLREEADHYELTGPLPPLAIPATLQDSLMARLDRLATVKEVAQLGAVLGREFAYDLLQAVSPLDETTLQRGLAQLVEAELLYQRGLPPAGHLYLQACPDPGRRLSVAAQEHAAAVSPAHCPGAGGAVSRDCRDAARTAGASLHRGGPREQAIPYWQRAVSALSSARPMWKRSVTSRKGWRCSRRCRRRRAPQQELDLADCPRARP